MVKVILILFAIMYLSACDSRKESNFIVIGVENISSTAISCSEFEGSTRKSGIQVLCDEFNRFTQAYTPSTSASAAIASLITGLDPYQHNLRFNSYAHLSPEFSTVFEKATAAGLKTFFISSAPTTNKKLGFEQGVQQFDDRWSNSGFRSNEETFRITKNIIKEVQKNSFFGFIHLSALTFPVQSFISDTNEFRGTGYENALEDFDENLVGFFDWLKKENLWHNSRIILVGVTGKTTENSNDEPSAIQLRSSNMHVPLFFKDIKKPEVNTRPHSISILCSTKEVGNWLHESLKIIPDSSFSFKNFDINQFESNKDKFEKPIVLESAWSLWNNVGTIRSAVIDNNYLFVLDEKPLLFNKLTDNQEQSPQPINNSNQSRIKKYQDFLKDRGFENFSHTTALKKLTETLSLVKKSNIRFPTGNEVLDLFYLFEKNFDISENDVNLLLKKYSNFNDPCFINFFSAKEADFYRVCKAKRAQHFYQMYRLKKVPDKDLRLFYQTSIQLFSQAKPFYLNNFLTNLGYIPIDFFKITDFKNFLFQSLKSTIPHQKGLSDEN